MPDNKYRILRYSGHNCKFKGQTEAESLPKQRKPKVIRTNRTNHMEISYGFDFYTVCVWGCMGFLLLVLPKLIMRI